MEYYDLPLLEYKKGLKFELYNFLTNYDTKDIQVNASRRDTSKKQLNTSLYINALLKDIFLCCNTDATIK